MYRCSKIIQFCTKDHPTSEGFIFKQWNKL